jgi:hypothetical protein
MADWIPSIISAIAALVVAAFTAWYTRFHRGRVTMSTPQRISFLRGVPESGESARQKVVFGTTISSTGKRGRTIEAIFVKLSGEESGQEPQTFDNWWIESEKGIPGRSNGLSIKDESHPAKHHCYASEGSSDFIFRPGEYEIEVCARFVGIAADTGLLKSNLPVTENPLLRQQHSDCEVYFDWAPGTSGGTYHSHVKALNMAPHQLSRSENMEPRSD